MTPIRFGQVNARFAPPAGMDESQVATIAAYVGTIKEGTLDGSVVTVTAWQPTELEISRILAGQPIYFSMLGSPPPAHFLSTSFEEAINP
jgi:hypothetical protein